MEFELKELKFDLKQAEERRRKLLEHYGEPQKYLKPIESVLPRHLVNIKHTGLLRILAFSDYRVHDINLLLNLVKKSVEKPSIILYAGDDIARFVFIPEGPLKHLYTYVYRETVGEYNYFEELAREASYGLGAVRGNDDHIRTSEYIKGEKVYNLQFTWLKVGSYLIIRLEDAPAEYGTSTYAEADYRLRLELAKSLLGKKDKLIVVSHAPPHGILDRAMRYGERSVGSRALREFIEERDEVVLAVCGHVHRCGGKCDRVGSATVVNVSSHDDYYSRANIAWITVEGESVNVEFKKLPSPVEQVFREMDRNLWNKILTERFRMSNNEARLLITMYERFGDKLLEDLEDLASLKFRYGFTWDNVFRFYAYGVKSPEQITENIYLRVFNESKFPHNINIKTAYTRLKREREGGIYLLDSPPFSTEDRLIVFDMEYIPGGPAVLYGFFDLVANEVKQFWFNEQSTLLQFLEEKRRENHIFIHWGGEDKKRLLSLINNVKVVNLLWYVQTSLVAPTTSNILKDIHDVLCGHKDDEWWSDFFYNANGFLKLAMCKRILESRSQEDMRRLSEMNKADLLALACVVKRTLELPVKQDTDQETRVVG